MQRPIPYQQQHQQHQAYYSNNLQSPSEIQQKIQLAEKMIKNAQARRSIKLQENPKSPTIPELTKVILSLHQRLHYYRTLQRADNRNLYDLN